MGCPAAVSPGCASCGYFRPLGEPGYAKPPASTTTACEATSNSQCTCGTAAPRGPLEHSATHRCLQAGLTRGPSATALPAHPVQNPTAALTHPRSSRPPLCSVQLVAEMHQGGALPAQSGRARAHSPMPLHTPEPNPQLTGGPAARTSPARHESPHCLPLRWAPQQ